MPRLDVELGGGRGKRLLDAFPVRRFARARGAWRSGCFGRHGLCVVARSEQTYPPSQQGDGLHGIPTFQAPVGVLLSVESSPDVRSSTSILSTIMLTSSVA